MSIALPGFLLGGPPCRSVEAVSRDPVRLRLLTLLRMCVFRRRDGRAWPYRHRRSAALRFIRAWLPDWLWYRGLVLPLCVWELTRLTIRNVRHFGAQSREISGMGATAQFADVLATCLANPGTLPTEYFVFGMHQPAVAARAPLLANGYEVETVVALRQPADHLLRGSGFPSEDAERLNNKESFRRLCRSLGLPVAPCYAVFDRGTAQWTDHPGLPQRDLFLKPVYGGGGYGATRAIYDQASNTYRLDRLRVPVTRSYPDSPVSPDALIAWLTETSATIGFIVEPRLTVHPDLSAVVGNATLSTLRVVTVLDHDDVCQVLYVYLRSAVVDSPVDNVSAGGLAALVDLHTGRLGRATTGFGQQVDEHPLTGRRLTGLVVPFLQRVLEVCRAAHIGVARDETHLVPVLGWDVAVTADGPCFLEGNPLSDLSTAQKLSGQGSWTQDAFRQGVLSHLAPIEGTRVSLDPGA